LNFDPAYLAAAFFVSGIGFVLFRYGRKQHRAPHAVIGLVMLIYPYAVSDVAIMLALVPVLCGLLWLAVRLGI
jgi:hypothetical protein